MDSGWTRYTAGQESRAYVAAGERRGRDPRTVYEPRESHPHLLQRGQPAGWAAELAKTAASRRT